MPWKRLTAASRECCRNFNTVGATIVRDDLDVLADVWMVITSDSRN